MNKKITFTEALLTAVGMVIGSGIFFRAARILDYTHANIGIAVLGWLVLGLTLVFAGIGFSVLASRTKREGGIVGYMEDTYGKVAGFLTGWFTTFIYIPLLMGILAIVASGFIFNLIGNDSPSAFAVQALALFLLLACWGWNYLSTRFSALFSSAATIIKLLPIVIVGLIGITHLPGRAGGIVEDLSHFNIALFTAPLLSMAFAFDGWTSVATLSRDMENPQKDIAKVLALNAVIVTAAYVLYFTGMTLLFNNPQEIIDLGNAHVGAAAQSIFGQVGAKLIYFCVIVSVLGTLNGNLMAAFRYPHALAVNNDLPNSNFFAQESKYGTTGNASLITGIAALAWFVLYTIQAFAAEGANGGRYMFDGIAFDDIPIMAMSIIIILLLIQVIKVGPGEGYGTFKSIIAPVIGIIGQAFVVVSFIGNNSQWWLYTLVCVVILAVGYFINKSVKEKQVNA